MQLTIGERLAIIKILNTVCEGLDFNGLRLAWKVADKIELSEDEIKEYKEITKVEFAKNSMSVSEIGFTGEEQSFLVVGLTKFDKDKLFAMDNGRSMPALCEKLGFKESKQ